MKMTLSQRFYFEAAHTLRRQVDAAASAVVHGHTYHCEVSVVGVPDADGFIVDLAVLRARLSWVRATLDHRMLDDVPNLGPATLENLCAYVMRAIPEADRVAVWREASGDRCEVQA